MHDNSPAARPNLPHRRPLCTGTPRALALAVLLVGGALLGSRVASWPDPKKVDMT